MLVFAKRETGIRGGEGKGPRFKPFRGVFKIEEQSIFISDEDIAFPSYAAFMATYTHLNPGESGENIRYWRSVQNDVDPEYYEREPELGGGTGRPRTLNSDVQAKVGFS